MKRASGIVGSNIPQSKRPDGTIRKAIKVRPGFIPAEDQIKFQSMKITEQKQVIPGTNRKRIESQPTKSSITKQKKRDSSNEDQTIIQSEFISTNQHFTTAKVEAVETSKIKDLQTLEKKKRALIKKIRQINDLVTKPNLNDEQREKMSKKDSVMKELEMIEKEILECIE
jgi:partner of Y14 and mago protein